MGKRSIWHGLFLILIREHFYTDQLQATKGLGKLIAVLLINLHKIWIARYEIIYKKFTDRVNIEERVELMNELYSIIKEEEYNNLPQEYRDFSETQIKELPNVELKDILFSYYSNVGDINAYQELNKRSKSYVQKLNFDLSEEGFTIRERLIARELYREANQEED